MGLGAFSTDSESNSTQITQDTTGTAVGYGAGAVSNLSTSTGIKGKYNTTTDHGAVAAGVSIASSQIEFAEGAFSTTAQLLDQTYGTAMGMVRDAMAKSIDAIAGNSSASINAIEKANRAESSEQGRLLFTGSAAIIGLIAIVMIAKALK
jgi:hypothetical protein